MKTAHYSTLTGENQKIARLAGLARLDTIHGGAAALVLAEKTPSLAWVVSQVYSESTGRHSKTLEAWECPECGNAHLGQDAAFQCCQPNPDESWEDMAMNGDSGPSQPSQD